MILAAPLPPAAIEQQSGDHAFAAALYRAAARSEGNVFLSPAGVRLALAMAAAGALGDTAAEMQSVLQLDKSASKTNAAFHALLEEWSARGKAQVASDAPAFERERASREAIQLHVVNRLWGQSGFKFRAPFLETLEKSYHAPLEQLDFAEALDASVARINAWVAEQTSNRIQNLIAPGTLKPDARLVLTNAIYFKAAWSTPFNKSATSDADFHSGATTVRAPTMHLTERLSYGETADAKLLELPYGDGSMSLVLVLPNAVEGLRALEDSLSGAAFAAWLAALQPARVRVSLPRFKIESSFSLAEALRSLGMKTAFTSGAANFSGMDGARDLFLGEVVHKAFVQVDEEGTEAAAATAVTMRAGAVMREDEPKVFNVDHPFFFFIRDVKSGAVLFAGRILNPV